MRGYYDYGPMTAHNDWGYGLIGLSIFAIFLVVIALIVARLLRHHGNRWFAHREPMDIAKERYAKGEIDKAQYDQLLKDLK